MNEPPISIRRMIAPRGRRLLARRLPSSRVGGMQLARSITARHGRPAPIEEATRLVRPRMELAQVQRAGHTRAVARAPEADQPAMLDALVAAADLYTWKLFRRDMGRSREATRDLVAHLIRGAVAAYTDAPEEAR